MSRNQIFVSYSHVDSEHLQRLRIHLRPFERTRQVDVWADTRISPGSRWKLEIRTALERAAVAVLLVTADFLASDFIAENELPPLLLAANKNGVRIIPIIIKPCAYVDTELSEIQALNDPKKPLILLGEGEREELWCLVARTVKNELSKLKPMSWDSASFGTPGMVLAAPKPSLVPPVSGGINPEDYFGIFGEELRDPRVIDEFFVYQYHFLDDLSFSRSAGDVLGNFRTFLDLKRGVESRFKKAGWEGDGDITLLWLPPFVGAGMEDTHGTGLWHVKQSNNGTSWIASPIPLPFGRLLEQNRGSAK